MPTFRIEMHIRRSVVFYIEAAAERDIHDFLEDNAEWVPGDIDGLIDHVDDEEDLGYEVADSSMTAGFRINGAGDLVETDG